MAKGNILGKDRINSYYCISCPDMLKTYQRDTELFEFSRDTSREDLEIKNDVTLQWHSCSGFIAMVFASPIHLCLQTKLSSFLTMCYTGENRLYYPGMKR